MIIRFSKSTHFHRGKLGAGHAGMTTKSPLSVAGRNLWLKLAQKRRRPRTFFGFPAFSRSTYRTVRCREPRQAYHCHEWPRRCLAGPVPQLAYERTPPPKRCRDVLYGRRRKALEPPTRKRMPIGTRSKFYPIGKRVSTSFLRYVELFCSLAYT